MSADTSMFAFHWRSRIQRVLEITVRDVSLSCSGTFAQMQVARLCAVTQSMVVLLFPMICDMHSVYRYLNGCWYWYLVLHLIQRYEACV